MVRSAAADSPQVVRPFAKVQGLRLHSSRSAGQLLLILILVAACPAWAATYVQGNSDSLGSRSSDSLTFPSATTSGNLIVVSVGWSELLVTASISDNKGNTYTSAIGPTNGPQGARAQTFYAQNITGGATHTVTVTYSGTVGFQSHCIHEYSGAATTGVLDVAAAASGTSTAPSASGTTTNANDLIFGWCYDNNGTLTAGSGFTVRQAPDVAAKTEDKNVTSTGSWAANWSLSPSDGWIAQMAAFKDAGGGAAAPKRLPLLGVGAAMLPGFLPWPPMPVRQKLLDGGPEGLRRPW